MCLVVWLFPEPVRAAQTATPSIGAIGPLSASALPAGVRSRFVDGVNGLRVHVLEAGFETPGRPALVLPGLVYLRGTCSVYLAMRDDAP